MPNTMWLLSILGIVLVLLQSVNQYRTGKVVSPAKHSEFVLFLLLLGAITDQDMRRAITIALIAGPIQILADAQLTKYTLLYHQGNDQLKIWHTPIWMTRLWVIALTQIIYWFYWLEQNIENGPRAIAFFIATSFIYFLVFELIVGNFAPHWWARHNCWQPFGVASYALVAEIASLILTGMLLNASVFSTIMNGILVGSFLLVFFVFTCRVSYQPVSN